MLSRNIILLTLDAFGGQVSGRTLLIKRVYFLSELLGKDLGYFAHYYGPYSDEITGDITVLRNLGLVTEKTFEFAGLNGGDFEVRRYDYKLSEAGRRTVQWLKEQYPQEATEIGEAVEKIRNAGDLDYVDLSIAAKAFLILKQANRPMTPQAIMNEAGKFSWKVSEIQIEKAIEFLKALGMVS